MGAVKHVRFRARVTGRVQGVYYRASCRERARELDLVGWVRNLSDGSVELEAQGPAEAVEALLSWCSTGPEMARVTGVEAAEIAAVDGEGGFVVAYR